CLDVVAEKTSPVEPGYRRTLKSAEVIVCSNDRRARRQDSQPKRTTPAIAKGVLVDEAPRAKQKKPPEQRKPPMQSAPGPPTPPPPAGAEIGTATCPVCGDTKTGIPGKRRCTNCAAVF